jgi:adenylate kinase family enzyme
MNLILSLRGTSGSGKTTVARKFITDYTHKVLPEPNRPKKPWGYVIDLTKEGIQQPLIIIGSYENTCGGTDGINTQEEIAERALASHSRGHVLLEGLLLSKVGPNAITTKMLAPTNAYAAAYLDTPLQTCLDRVTQRRLDRGDERPFNPANTISAYKATFAACKNLHEQTNVKVITIDYKNAFQETLDVFRKAENGLL